nr:hypothetical protein [Tanacetum cinerariifolium]
MTYLDYRLFRKSRLSETWQPNNHCKNFSFPSNPDRSYICTINAATLFGSGSNYSFVSTTFIPLLDIEPNDLGFSYEFEIASGKLVKIDKVIRGYKLEIEGRVFDINLLPFGSESFDVIIGIDWLSDHKAEIICHDKLMSAKAKEKKQEEIMVLRDFPEVFSNDLSGLPSLLTMFPQRFEASQENDMIKKHTNTYGISTKTLEHGILFNIGRKFIFERFQIKFVLLKQKLWILGRDDVVLNIEKLSVPTFDASNNFRKQIQNMFLDLLANFSHLPAQHKLKNPRERGLITISFTYDNKSSKLGTA